MAWPKSFASRIWPEAPSALQKRDWFQAQIDAWHEARQGQAHDDQAYMLYLRDIGYIVPEPDDFEIESANCDLEIAVLAGPQLVVPVLNERFLLNAANARWGSLYDALYGTDALMPASPVHGFDHIRSKAVIEWSHALMDEIIPKWREALRGADHHQLVGRCEKGIIFTHHGLHIEIVIDPETPLGRQDRDHVSDIRLEAALSTIVDFEEFGGLCGC